MRFFNYIFFRIAQARFKRDNATASTAVALVTLLQAALILSLVIEPISILLFTREELAIHAKKIGWLAGLVSIALLILNYRKYSGKYKEYQACWQNESPAVRFYKGLLILLCFIVPVVATIITNHILQRG